MATRNLLVRAGFDASGMSRGTRQANNALRQFGQNANRQMSGLSNTISSSMGKIGKFLAGAFAIGSIVKFGKECIDLGSDLSEVQNVVDVTFGSMAEDVNEFAKTAITQLGLSETSAKQYTSTMGAMLKSMGLTTSEALTMSKTITGLSADMASFYNLDPSEAFAKIRSGISGETEPLKQLGINMSVANMQAYAMAQGITKAYSKMTQQEQALLRYNYLLSVTADAQGDFSRTSDSWANQTRILSEQFNALKAEIGQGLIAAFTPVVQALNVLINKLRVAVGYFRSFMELIFGKQESSGGSGLADVSESTDTIVDSASGASDAVEGVGDAAKSAGKKAKGALASFDELNQLASSSDSSSGSGSGSSAIDGLDNMGGAVDVDLGEATTETDQLSTMFDGVIVQLTKMKNLFAKGFKIGFETANLDALNEAISNIKTSFMNLFSDGTILNAFTSMLDSLALNVGQVAGFFVSIGVTIATNLIGGISTYLNENTQFIKDRLVGIFDAKAEIYSLWGEYSTAFAEIFSALGGEAGQQITANIIGVFSNGFLGILELSTKLGRDIMMCITQPIVDNKESLKQALEGTLEVISVVTGTLKDLITDTMQKAVEVYDEYLRPAFENIESGISEIVGALTDAYNAYIQPTLMRMGKSWDSFYTDSLKPVIDKALEVFGKLVEGVSEIWKKTLAPFVAWAIDILAPYLATAFENISEAFKVASEIIVGIVDSLLTVFGGLIDFVVGVFTGDWSRAWEGVKAIFKGIVDTFESLTLEPLGKILSYVTGVFARGWKTGWESAGKVFSTVFDGLKNAAKTPLNWVIDMINKVLRGVNSITSTLNSVPGVNIGTIPQIPKLARGGVVDKGTIFEAGEDGGEAIVPLENNTEWTGQVASLLANALTPFLGGASGGNSGQYVGLEMDGVQFARTATPYIIKEMKRLNLV